MARYAIFGDSYVSRLEDFCKKMPLDDFDGECRFFGVPGMTTRNKFDDAFQQMMKYKPLYAFINLGGNDIDITTPTSAIVDRLLYIYKSLKQHGARRVLVASIIERGKVRKMSVARFNKIRNGINKKLRAALGREFVDVMTELRYPMDYDADKVHPGEREGGMTKLRDLIRRCLRAAPSKC